MMLQLLPNITISLVDNFFKAGASLNTCVATKHEMMMIMMMMRAS
jgi:hypothetical protein